MRKQLLGLILPLLAIVLIAAAADMPGKGTAATSALQRLEVAHGQDGLRVEFTAKGVLAPKVTTLDSPARIVVDLPNTVMATGQQPDQRRQRRREGGARRHGRPGAADHSRGGGPGRRSPA